MPWFEFESMIFWLFYLYLCFFWRIVFSCLMVYRWQVWHGGQHEDRGRSRRPGAEDRGWSAEVGYAVAGRSRGRVILCAVCTMHVEMRSMGFLVEPQNQARWYGLKTTGTVFSVLASKPVASGFSVWASKLVAMVW
jgi:hypothetical protein